MGIAPVIAQTRSLYKEQQADIERFEVAIAQYLAGEIEEDVFRVIRLNNGVYGQRQGGTNQMVRIKLPAGTITPEQLELMAKLSTEYSRGWGHITTRQNIQFHFVELTKMPALLREIAEVGLTSREACGDTVRNVMACHLAGACPHEKLDVTPWAEATFRHFVRNPIGQRLPRKFKVNFSGCSTDCGQAMFNDFGVVATSRTNEDGTVEPGFRVYIAGGLGATPHPALALEDFTSREDLLPTIEATLRVFDQTGNRDNKLRARLKWVVDQLGIDEVRRRVIKVRHTLPASSTWPGGIPPEVVAVGDKAAGAVTSGDLAINIANQIDRIKTFDNHVNEVQRNPLPYPELRQQQQQQQQEQQQVQSGGKKIFDDGYQSGNLIEKMQALNNKIRRNFTISVMPM
jgi:sulfite reductase beta subunit-like hemoprotein